MRGKDSTSREGFSKYVSDLRNYREDIKSYLDKYRTERVNVMFQEKHGFRPKVVEIISKFRERRNIEKTLRYDTISNMRTYTQIRIVKRTNGTYGLE
jgi:hypothetical protein